MGSEHRPVFVNVWLKVNATKLVVAPHERLHYIFIRFWKEPTESAILFARSRPCSSQNQFVPGFVRIGLHDTSLTKTIQYQIQLT